MTTLTPSAQLDQTSIRVATAADATSICDLWNTVIRDTTLTFTSTLRSPDDIATLLQDKATAGQPFLVSHNGAGIISGFATYGPFRGGNGYRHTVEHTVYLAPHAQGARIGRHLMASLCNYAKAQGMHSLWAACSAENPGAVAFHRALGFTQIAHLPQVGRKFDRWIDLILLQKLL